jgi:hypothetical protein
MITAIFTVNPQIGVEYLKSYIGEMKFKDVKYFFDLSKNNMTKRAEAQLNNGDVFLVFSRNLKMICGFRWNKAIVSTKMSQELMDNIYAGMYLDENRNDPTIEFMDFGE